MIMLEILFVTDYVCPYCILAKEALKRALKKTGLEAKITYQPLLLKPKPPVQFDPNDPQVIKRFETLTSAAHALDIDMKIPVKVTPRPVSQKAFEGWYYACEQGKGDEYADLMYRSYFVDEKDIGDPAVLRALAESIGLNGEEYAEVLSDGRFADTVLSKDDHSRNGLKVRGIPTLFIDGIRTQFDEYSVDEVANVLLGIADGGSSMVCGEDGCAPAAPETGVCGKDGCK